LRLIAPVAEPKWGPFEQQEIDKDKHNYAKKSR